MAEITLFTEKIRNPVDNSWIALRKVKGDSTSGNITSIENLTPDGTSTLNISTIVGTAPITANINSGTVTIVHANSGVTANTYGTIATAALTPTFGGTFNVPGFKVDARGHITSAGNHTVKIPATTATTAAAGLMSAEDKTKLNGIVLATTAVDGLMPSAAVTKLNSIVTATTAVDGLMPSAAVTKLNGIATGAEVNQNAYGKLKIGSTTVTASSKTDTVTFAATGNNLTVTFNSSNNIVYEAIPAAVVSTTTPTQTGVSIWIKP